MVTFADCIYEQMERKRFGKTKADEVVKRFNGLTAQYRAQGMADPELHAMTRAFNEMNMVLAERTKRSMATLMKTLDQRDFQNATPLTPYNKNKIYRVDPGTKVSTLVSQNQQVGGLSYTMQRYTAFGQIMSGLNDVLKQISKGVGGIQRGSPALMKNIVRELYGINTGDRSAREAAIAWRKGTDLTVEMFNQAGGSLRKLADFRLPQRMAAAKLVKTTFPKWAADMEKWLDWNKMFYPDGTPIPAADRTKVLTEVFNTLATGGANKIKPGSFAGQGAAIGNALDQHRFLVFKDAESWQAMHEAYGDGNLFDVMVGHMETMAHEIALLRQFGPNPRQGYQTARALAMKQAAEMDREALARGETGPTWTSLTEATLQTADRMAERMFRDNPMNPNSILGTAVTSISELLHAALLGSTSLLAVPGDLMTAANVSKLNGMGFTAPIKAYMDAVFNDPVFMKEMATQYGFIYDELTTAHYAASRYLDFNTHAPAWSRRISDTIMRASFLSGHTNRIRWATQMEFMGAMYRARGQTFEQTPFRRVMERNGLTEADWNTFRALTPDEPKPGVFFQAPIKLLDTNLPDKQRLYALFQGMLFQESRNMVPEGNIETSVSLKLGTRPDSLGGAILHSFAMYKSFPVSILTGMGRLALSSEKTAAGRVAWHRRPWCQHDGRCHARAADARVCLGP